MKSFYDELGTEEVLSEALERKECLEQSLEKLDRVALEKLVDQYKEFIPPERVEAVRETKSEFIHDREEFNARYESVTGETIPEQIKIRGYSQGPYINPTIAVDSAELPRAIYHERLHQLSHPGIEKEIGRHLDEGITEDLALKEWGRDSVEEVSYPAERSLARDMRELCGNRAIEKTYFQGDVSELRACLDRELGPSGLEKIRNYIDGFDERGAGL
ncbi:MAG: hypothetical protein GX130_07460 [Candidatus Hydrogenedens sp.]|jgi:hypothetical protein|nr:hypothetical protein [Candidatus Hydrogenedens sp.]